MGNKRKTYGIKYPRKLKKRVFGTKKRRHFSYSAMYEKSWNKVIESQRYQAMATTEALIDHMLNLMKSTVEAQVDEFYNHCRTKIPDGSYDLYRVPHINPIKDTRNGK